MLSVRGPQTTLPGSTYPQRDRQGPRHFPLSCQRAPHLVKFTSVVVSSCLSTRGQTLVCPFACKNCSFFEHLSRSLNSSSQSRCLHVVSLVCVGTCSPQIHLLFHGPHHRPRQVGFAWCFGGCNKGCSW